ncbi:putative precorrin-3B synthase (CobG) [Bradyrhizobium sp. STM 3843]|uniref:precorrin-3B synthase n=1 Tax=Bradyrhizobium sp. STM 3843 TaxID=551947 RepID=UPI000240AA40|nr:precorrin-3B synthase [Bradyrhizobium sp. STM 3843]CCE05295.1 putative precorrin-3B synthase (CobG) [Bradyrhizobium sp. STM 3843]
MTGSFAIKGWCPGARRPMQSGDGLVVRVRPHAGSVPVGALKALADAAARFGNGQIDLTRRANLQLRGVTAETLAPLWSVLAALDLLDDDAEREAIRNIVINPLAGVDPTEVVDMRPVARALECRLAAGPGVQQLPGKFGFLLDGGGCLPLLQLEADIHLVACRDGADASIAIGLDGPDGLAWLGSTAAADAAAIAVQLALAILKRSPTGRARALSSEAVSAIRAELGLRSLDRSIANVRQVASQARGLIALANGTYAVGLGAVFGRLDSEAMAALAFELARLGIAELRLSPWRTLYAGIGDRADGERLLAFARGSGLIVDDADPLTRVDACSGVGSCSSTTLATRQHARVLADMAESTGFSGTLHVSGCAKGCARSALADLVFIGDGDHYRVVRQGTVKDNAFAELDPAQIATAGHALLTQEKSAHV